jgi:hypothetical protein
MTIHYFAADGNFGNATNLVIVDTTDWTDEEWADVEYAIDDQRSTTALSLSTSKKVSHPDQLSLPMQF